MLGHGFVDEPHGDGFGLDESDPIAYGVVRLGRTGPPATMAAASVIAAIIAIAIIVIVL